MNAAPDRPVVERIGPDRPPPAGPPTDSFAFRIGTLMIFIALLAVNLGVWHESPALGVIMSVVSIIALARAMAPRGREDSPRVTMAERIGIFLMVVVAIVVEAISGFIAIAATCFVVVSIDSRGIIPGLLLGGIAAVVAVALLARVFRALDHRTRNLGQSAGQPELKP